MFTTPNKTFLEAVAAKWLLDAACAYVHSAIKSKAYDTAPNKTFLEAGAGLGPKRLLDAACAHTRPTNPRSTTPNEVFWEAGAALGCQDNEGQDRPPRRQVRWGSTVSI